MNYNCQQLFRETCKDLDETYLITNEFQVVSYKVLLEKNLYETYLITNEFDILIQLWYDIMNWHTKLI